MGTDAGLVVRRQAAKIIRQYGWWDGRAPREGCECITTAMARGCAAVIPYLRRYRLTLLEATCKQIVQELDVPRIAVGGRPYLATLQDWNDSPGRTMQEVLDVFGEDPVMGYIMQMRENGWTWICLTCREEGSHRIHLKYASEQANQHMNECDG